MASAVTSACPRCRSHRVHPSRARSLFERVRRALTEKQPYRCHACNYRAWHPIDVPFAAGPETDPDALRAPAPPKPLSVDDLDRLDRDAHSAISRRDAESGPR